ncbi:iron-chelator utilization protein [Pelagibacterium halotolerans B2]|uniref:Iron-chelator utilization protein n=1 Tax=Pelagibacterium halotolerans (strain DSM 22347 / JCM 15775 / CGMCC 1.7692 / B2) TaxID=1082931 RepID=G4R9V4_PELHB|nr:siderophore-interacting protein [Pelagibacterium halotolerans]AEQ52481.1 iron-chelator utilization protein [Pelagibacterium halotolerans B2]
MNFEKPAVIKLPIVLREIEVARTQMVSATLRRIWFKGEQLQGFSKDGRDLPPFRSEGPDDHVKFFFSSPVDGTLSLPVQADGTIDWPKNPRPVARDYTPRGYCQGDGEVAFDFVLHGHGIASTWAATAEQGDKLHMAGPKASLIIPQARHFVLVADQTALPALANWLERLPGTARVDAVIWIDDEASRIALETRASANIAWITDPSADGEKLLEALKSLPAPDGDSFVWGAMEASVLRKVRAYYLDTCKLDRGQIDMAAYWRRGVDDDELLAQAFRLRELTDLQKPYAIRAAVQFRLPDLVAEGVDDISVLARRAGVDAEALSRLMPVYVECGMFKLNGDKITLGLTGDLLTSPYRRNMLSSDTAQGRMHLSAQGMAHFLKTGQSGYRATFGTALEDDAASDARIGEGLGHDLGHIIEALTAQTLGPLASACGSTVTTPGAQAAQ